MGASEGPLLEVYDAPVFLTVVLLLETVEAYLALEGALAC